MDKKQEVMARLAELKSRLIGQRTTRGIVRFPMSADEAALYLLAAIQAEVERRGRMFEDSPGLHEHIRKIAGLFTTPTTKFGIMLCGGVGNGKSTMLKALQNLLNYLQIPNNNSSTFSTYGMRIESAKFLCHQIRVDPKNLLHFQQLDMLGIDDLGEEEASVMDYGNRVTPVIDLLSYRYDRMLFTMVTTNLTPAQIRSTYGDRIADRFNEMMLIIPYQEPSFRTPQHAERILDDSYASDH